jgi:adenylate kinase
MVEVKHVAIGLAAVNARMTEQVVGDPPPLLLLISIIVRTDPGKVLSFPPWVIREVSPHVFALVCTPCFRVFQRHVLIIPAYEAGVLPLTTAQ